MAGKNIKLSTLRPNPGNPRLIKDDKFKKLCDSIKQFPRMMELRPIVIDEKCIILGGNMRFNALKELGYKDIPQEWVKQASELTEEQKQEFIVKDNVGFGEWDWDLLANEWDAGKLIEWGMDLPADMMVDQEAQEDDFDVPVGGSDTDIVIGDLFEIGQHRLLCGDSTDSDAVAKLMDGEKADMVFTSPPYNGNTTMYEATGSFNDKNKIRTDKTLYINNETDNKTADDYIKFNSDIFNTIKTIASDELVILYNINYNRNSPSEFIDVVNRGRDVFSLVETIIWEKSMAISLAGDNLTRIFEFIFLFYNGKDKPKMNKTHSNECIKNLWKISNVGANQENHKACFPVKLVEQGIKIYAKPEANIFEPFTGSGTTMVASHQLGRKCYGMELDPKYCQVIVDRMIALDSTLEIKRNGKAYKPKAK